MTSNTTNTNRRVATAAIALAAITAGLGFTTPASAQTASWPTKPVRFTVPAAAGTAPDVIVRVLGEKLSRMWGQQVLIDNRPGAGGVIGMVSLKGGEKDDHGFGFVQASVLTLAPYMYRSTQVNVPEEFTPFALVGLSPMMLAVAANSPVNSLAELVTLAKTKPGGIVAAVPMQYSTPHLAAEMLAKVTGAPIRSIPFSNTAQTVSAVISDDAQLTVDGVPPLEGMVKGGKLKALGIFSDGRLASRPQLAAVGEGYADMVINGWFAIVAPKGTAPKAMQRIHDDLATVVAMPDVIERLDSLGVFPKPMSQTEVAAYVGSERTRWEKVLRDLNAQPMN
ncbi:tripartite tricarboxylate transporter substrate binding protein [soil metagenome]